MDVKVKICGITNLEDARFCAGAGADFLGFIQYPASPRYIEPRAARAVLDWIYGPETVGVFVNEDADVVNRTAETAGFTMVQLHGSEPPDVCAAVALPVIKAFRVSPATSSDDLRRMMEPYLDHAAYFLLDTHHAHLWGGTGRPFDWRQARRLSGDFPILLAGGIDAANLETAVRTVRPAGVDLSSSLEATPGKKDLDKLNTFFDALDALRQAPAIDRPEDPGEDRAA